MSEPNTGTEPHGAGDSALRDDLSTLGRRAAVEIQRRRLRQGWRVAVTLGMRAVWVVPCAFVGLEAGRVVARLPAEEPWSWPALIGATLVPPALIAAFACWRFRSAAVAGREGLGAVDRAQRLHDRLVTADEFLARGPRTGFEAAAVADAEVHARRLAQSEVDLGALGKPWRMRQSWVGMAFAAVLLCVGFWLDRVEREPAPEADPGSTPVAGGPVLDPQDDTADPAGPALTPDADAEARPRGARRPPTEESSRAQSAEHREEASDTRSARGAGQAGQAMASQGASHSKSVPSNQGPTKPQEQPEATPLEKKRNDEKRDQASEPPPDQKPAEESGATAGRGSSKGSNKNPAASEWSSKDQVTSPEDKGVEDDQEIDDEEEEQESRGGIQPNLRDRKPPVNRDLRIGFGNRPNPDANGRGGPSEQKKSRGVAALVLGVPIPDRIKGQPSKGKTKITQERIEPQPEDAESIAATARTPRSGPLGNRPHREAPLDAALRDLVRQYFDSLRKTDRP